MSDLATKIASIPDEELGAWMRKAVSDWQNGCADPSTDRFVREVFEKALEKMNSSQNHNRKMYCNRLARQGKELKNSNDTATTPDNTISAKTDAEAVSLIGSPENGVSHCAKAPASNILPLDNTKHPYGTCGHVMLTVAEGHHLRELYGDNLKIAIDILDAYIENNGKAAKKYKNHAAVLRKGNWVWNKVQEMVLQQARIDKAKSQPKSFKQQDLDARTQFFQTSIVERMIQNEQ